MSSQESLCQDLQLPVIDIPSSTAQLEAFSNTQLHEQIEKTFNKRPCAFQYKLLQAQLSGKNLISIARTGSGKTLTYFMPLVAVPDSMIVIVTALNVLGEQFEREAKAAKIEAISVNGENESDAVFKVSIPACGPATVHELINTIKRIYETASTVLLSSAPIS